jgi:hypothetical protein
LVENSLNLIIIIIIIMYPYSFTLSDPKPIMRDAWSIYIRVKTITMQFEFSNNKHINSKRWSTEVSKVKGASEETRTVNSNLENIKQKILAVE